ncbi:unnamed protein product [Dovyalis caffra]|uniref:Uncharacterized protein n=1 Tax=Dovyalis caffra TaxID=77055 RepID=A0AAV1S6H0_9ROSI|nr:unnamed protein product [Dovyalis caffra]
MNQLEKDGGKDMEMVLGPASHVPLNNIKLRFWPSCEAKGQLERHEGFVTLTKENGTFHRKVLANLMIDWDTYTSSAS